MQYCPRTLSISGSPILHARLKAKAMKAGSHFFLTIFAFHSWSDTALDKNTALIGIAVEECSSDSRLLTTSKFSPVKKYSLMIAVALTLKFLLAVSFSTCFSLCKLKDLNEKTHSQPSDAALDIKDYYSFFAFGMSRDNSSTCSIRRFNLLDIWLALITPSSWSTFRRSKMGPQPVLYPWLM